MARSVLVLLSLLAPAVALAEAELLESLEDVRAACEEAEAGGRSRLYAIRVDAGWTFGAHSLEEQRLPVDTRRNLRALEGRISLLSSNLEPVAFEADADRADALRTAAGGGVLVVGFFLGFDEPGRRPCLLRNRHAVSILRVDLAYVELQSADGARLHRTETDRLRAWSDDTVAIPGEGPRGRVRPALFVDGAEVPEAWQRSLERDGIREGLGRCHAEGLARGAAPSGQVVVRLNVETRTGRIRRADVALSSIGDDGEAECVARTLGRTVRLPPGPRDWSAEVVDLAVPVQLAR